MGAGELEKIYADRGAGRKKHGKSSSMATIDETANASLYGPPRRGLISRTLERRKRWLASVLLLPTIVLLGLFIAYPFVRGVCCRSPAPWSACRASSSA